MNRIGRIQCKHSRLQQPKTKQHLGFSGFRWKRPNTQAASFMAQVELFGIFNIFNVRDLASDPMW